MTRITENTRRCIIADLATMSVADVAASNYVSISTVYRIQRAEHGQISVNINRQNRINRGWAN